MHVTIGNNKHLQETYCIANDWPAFADWPVQWTEEAEADSAELTASVNAEDCRALQ